MDYICLILLRNSCKFIKKVSSTDTRKSRPFDFEIVRYKFKEKDYVRNSWRASDMIKFPWQYTE